MSIILGHLKVRPGPKLGADEVTFPPLLLPCCFGGSCSPTMRLGTSLKTSLLIFATSTTAHPQTFSLAIGFGSDSAPLTFFPDLATPAPAPSR